MIDKATLERWVDEADNSFTTVPASFRDFYRYLAKYVALKVAEKIFESAPCYCDDYETYCWKHDGPFEDQIEALKEG